MIHRAIQRFDPYVLLLALICSVAGLLVIFDAGYARSMAAGRGVVPREFTMQAISLLVAAVAGILLANVGVRKLYRSAKAVWWITFFSLAGLMTPLGYEMNGAVRWYKFGPVTIQPAEFAKVAAILFLAAALHKWKPWRPPAKRPRRWIHWIEKVGWPKIKRYAPALAVAVGIAMIVEEPDLGTGAVVAAIAWTLFAWGGASRRSMVLGTVAIAVLSMVAIKLEPYRWERIENHAHRWDPAHADDTGFQTVQSELAMASGGWTGVGLGAGRAKHIMPAATTDFVTATMAEELGLLGWTLMILPLAALSVRLLQLAPRAPTKFGMLVSVGTGAWLAIQSVVNIMMANGLMPAIGIPLPFYSSGGSSLIAIWLALGCSQAAMQPVEVRKEAAVETDRDRWRHGRTRLSGA